MTVLSRRRFLAACAVLAAGSYSYARWIEPHWYRIHYLDMPVRGLPAGMAGARLVQLSDLHVSREVDPDYLLACMDAVRALAPDIVAYTGDMVNATGTPPELLSRVLGGLAHGRLATFGVLGNHDYGHMWSRPAEAAALAAAMEEAGVAVLRNSVASVGGLQVLGLDDLWSGRCRITESIKKLDTTAAAVVLSHNPDSADEGDWGAYRGWILCGHTHGGQCKPPFLPPPLLPVRNRRYAAGLVDTGDGRTVYINRGLGHLLKARFNVRPEITCFTLVPGTGEAVRAS